MDSILSGLWDGAWQIGYLGLVFWFGYGAFYIARDSKASPAKSFGVAAAVALVLAISAGRGRGIVEDADPLFGGGVVLSDDADTSDNVDETTEATRQFAVLLAVFSAGTYIGLRSRESPGREPRD